MSFHQYLDTGQVSSLSDECNRKRHFTGQTIGRILQKSGLHELDILKNLSPQFFVKNQCPRLKASAKPSSKMPKIVKILTLALCPGQCTNNQTFHVFSKTLLKSCISCIPPLQKWSRDRPPKEIAFAVFSRILKISHLIVVPHPLRCHQLIKLI